MRFIVLKHGGNSNHDWKPIIQTDDEAKAHKKFEAEYLKMRQGGLKLLDGENEIRRYFAPRLRSRW